MSRISIVTKARPYLSILFCLLLILVVALPPVLGRDWGAFLNPGLPSSDSGSSKDSQNALSDAQKIREKPVIALSETPSAKLFWVEFSPNMGVSIWFADPDASPPVATLFDDSIFLPWLNNKSGVDFRVDSFLTGNINSDYSGTDLKIGHVIYVKSGLFFAVDTTTLDYHQLSSESQANSLCRSNTFINWADPDNSTITYAMPGSDGTCGTADDVRKAITLGMDAADPPILMGKNEIQEILLDGRFIVNDNSTGSPQVNLCTRTACSKIASYSSSAETKEHDRARVVLLVDGKLIVYDLDSQLVTELYTVASAKEAIKNVRLDKDGSVYFLSLATVQLQSTGHFINYVNKVTPSGTFVHLTSFVTQYAIPNFNPNTLFSAYSLELTSSYVVYEYPDRTFSAQVARAIGKNGGKTTLLGSNGVQGIVAEGYYVYEDTSGRVQKVKLDGSSRTIRKDSVLVGGTMGGAGDWHYRYDPVAARVFIMAKDRSIRSYALDEDLSVTTSGVAHGTLPNNLSNLLAAGIEVNTLGLAGKRGYACSFGGDMVFLDAADTPSSLKRLTNSNGSKQASGMH